MQADRSWLLVAGVLAVAWVLWDRPLLAEDPPPGATSAVTAASLAIIPAPRKMKPGSGDGFAIDAGKTPIIAENAALTGVARYLSQALAPALGTAPKVTTTADQSLPAIRLKLDPNLPLGHEGYRLAASADGVTITARAPAGAFRGVQTLRQLLPPEALSDEPAQGVRWTVPPVEIEDQPRFAWRGLHLDVARHFYGVPEVKRVIDWMALHKFNTFHWHLTDDQGWRIEIKRYPKLTEVGAWRGGVGWDFPRESADPQAFGPDGRYGGFYTQEQVREVVAYAAERFITVVPEIEMPGHAGAALAAHPELLCEAAPTVTTDIKGGVNHAIFCASNPDVDRFIQGVLEEVLALFPGRFIHVGGDEVPKDPWKKCPRCQAYIKQRGLKDEDELQSDFIRRADAYLDSRGRRLIGWDEILEGGLAEGATVMSWRGITGGVAAAKAGHDVVMSPGRHCYLDHPQADPRTQPRSFPWGYLPMIRVYDYEPVPAELTPEQARHVLGVQGNVWTEFMPNFRQVQYMMYPRAAALAEVGWSAREQRDFADFKRRLTAAHFARLAALGINYCPDALDAPVDLPFKPSWETQPASSKPAATTQPRN